MSTTTTTEQVFAEYRDLLFSIAYRILGVATDAEDIVQDAWIKWSGADRSAVSDPKAYLARIVTNLAMDQLRSSRHRRETYVGPWLPEPILTTHDPAATAETIDSVSMALLVVLETLSPFERVVLVLKDVFDFSYTEIADVVGRSAASVRQAASRARGHVRARRPRFYHDSAQKKSVIEGFFAAAAGGDIDALLKLLAPDVTLFTDGGGKVRHAMRPISGRAKVAAWICGVSRRPYEGVEIADMSVATTEINGTWGMVIKAGDRVIATLTVDVDSHGRIAAIHNVANPDKLAAIASGRTYRMCPR